MPCNRCGGELNYPQESHSDLCVDCAKLNNIEKENEKDNSKDIFILESDNLKATAAIASFISDREDLSIKGDSSSVDKEPVQLGNESLGRTPKSTKEPPELIIMVQCPECKRKGTIEPKNPLRKTGNYSCGRCDVAYRWIATYEKIGE